MTSYNVRGGTFDAITFTSDLKHLQCVTCDVMKHCTIFERNRTLHSGVIAISFFYLMTLNMF